MTLCVWIPGSEQSTRHKRPTLQVDSRKTAPVTPPRRAASLKVALVRLRCPRTGQIHPLLNDALIVSIRSVTDTFVASCTLPRKQANRRQADLIPAGGMPVTAGRSAPRQGVTSRIAIESGGMPTGSTSGGSVSSKTTNAYLPAFSSSLPYGVSWTENPLTVIPWVS